MFALPLTVLSINEWRIQTKIDRFLCTKLIFSKGRKYTINLKLEAEYDDLVKLLCPIKRLS